MPGFEPISHHEEKEAPGTINQNARHGLRLFAIYFLFYAGFVLINAFRPDWTEITPIAGLNIAVLYGFGLIFGALVLSLVYGWLCHVPAKEDQKKDQP